MAPITIGAGQLFKIGTTTYLTSGDAILGYDAATGAGEWGYDSTLGAIKIRTGASTYVNIGSSRRKSNIMVKICLTWRQPIMLYKVDK